MDGRDKKSEPFMWVEEYTNLEYQQQQQQLNHSTRKRKKIEFLGWGSKPLIHFLASIGKDTTQPISQFDVTAIVNDYVDKHLPLTIPIPSSYNQYGQYNAKNKPKKQKRVQCDPKLQALFGRKSISRVMIYKLLERHLAEANSEIDSDASREDYLSCGNEDEEDEDDEEGKRKRRRACYTPREELSSAPIRDPRSCFAAVIPENLKLVYLKRSVIEDIVKKEDIDTLEKKIEGSFVRIKSDPNDCLQKYSHHLLLVTGIERESEGDDSNTRILLRTAGVIKAIPVSNISDDDFTKEECDDVHRRIKDGTLKKLTVEQLQQMAQILHEDIMKHWLARELTLLDRLIDRANEKGWRRELSEYLERKELLRTPDEQSRLLSEIPKIIVEQIEPEAKIPESPDDETHERNESPIEEKIPLEDPASELRDSDDNDDGFDLTWATYSDEESSQEPVKEGGNELEKPDPEIIIFGETQILNTVENKTLQPEPEIIDLSDDDEDDGEKPATIVLGFDDELVASVWNYLDPQGVVQGPFTLTLLKRWSDADYFPSDFRVWKMGQSSDEAVCLKDMLKILSIF